MSFLLRPSTSLVRTGVPRYAAIMTSRKGFATTLQQQNVIKETAQKVNQAVSDQLSKGLEAGQDLKDSAQATLNSAAEQVKGQASNIAGQVQGKASELQGEAKGKAKEVEGEVKAKTEEVKSKL